MDYIIETAELVKQYATKTAVNRISIHVKKGEIYGLIGKNGAGKTSLMKLILGLSTPTKGKIFLFGNENLSEGRRKIGSLIEAPGLYKNCTAYENMLRFCLLYNTSPKQIPILLQKVGLGNTGNRLVGQFSLGMRQRLGIAIALLGKPELLILDEPINGLDPAGIKEIRDIILSLHQEGVTFIISSHLLDELAKVVTTYGIIANGVLLEEISASELMSRCQKSIRICTTDDIKALSILRKQFPKIDAIYTEQSLIVHSHLDQTAQLNRTLIAAGIDVKELAFVENGFEEYFIERLGK